MELLGGLAVGAAFVSIGAVLATDFKGFTTWHVRSTFRLMAPVERVLKHVPPWSRLLDKPREEQISGQVRLERFMGVAFAALGLLLMLAVVVEATHFMR